MYIWFEDYYLLFVISGLIASFPEIIFATLPKDLIFT